ncbi:cell wall elongation regulator TseB-like domain-containing protein [Gracilibacillus salinarum]|uniref:DUF5590 domain-containing protein n=1 Tax=Gracilibacillus salinarum TaxID=2932255 RepID=A0ABY4GRE2_9BACI|nr:DUF5590 domain-containing protein [Gracilibacillus salinarum]UOQ85852.1 DUF5590 domain-containing protein [Gracilibacillus salinarum]
MKKQSLPFIGPNKWWLIVALIVIVALIAIYYFVSLYQDVIESKTNQFDEVRQYTLANTSLDQIHSMERYHGDQLYYVLEGEDDQQQDTLAYVFQTEDGQWDNHLYNEESFYSEKELLTEWRDRCNECEYLGSTFGIDEEMPILEIKYMDTSDRLVYEHVLLEDKTHYRLTLTPSFQY